MTGPRGIWPLWTLALWLQFYYLVYSRIIRIDHKNDEKLLGHFPRKDDLGCINQANLLKGTNALDKSMDAELKKYVDSVLMCAKYLYKKNGNTYITKRYSKMNETLSKLKLNRMY